MKIFLLFLFATGQFAAAAQNRLQEDSVTNMTEVMVTATRQATAMQQLPYAAVVQGRKAIERNLSRTVPESLTGVPGIFIQKTNHGGGSPFVRGLTGNQSLILVDGIRLNNSIFRYGPNQYMTLVDPFLVEKIDVIKGTGSVQYGTDAMTGVINLHTTTLRFRDKPRWSEKLSTRLTETAMERSLRPELKYEGKRFAFVLGGSGKEFGDLKGGDRTGFQRPSGYGEKSVDLKMMGDLGHGWTATVAYQWLSQNNLPVYHKYVLENFAINSSDPISRGFGYLKLNKDFNGPLFKSIAFTASNQSINETRFSQKLSSQVLRTEQDKVNTLSAGIDVLAQFAPYWTVNTGIEFYADKVASSRSDKNQLSGALVNLRGLYPDGAAYANFALYALHHLQFGKLNLEAGLRYNHYTASMTDITLGKITLNPSALVFQGGASYQLLEGLHLYANISEGFRAPNVDDLGTLGIVDFRYETPAFDLRPERALNTEAGLKYSAKKVMASAAIFRTNLYNLITRIKTGESISGYDVYRKINVDKGFIRGWEMQLQYRPIHQIILSAAATHLYGQSVTKNQPLRRIPPLNARLTAEYTTGLRFVGLTYDYASPQRRLESGDKSDNRIPAGGTPGYNVLNAYAGANFVEHITFRLHLTNIFNRDYRTHGSGINGMGRAISMVLTWQFNH